MHDLVMTSFLLVFSAQNESINYQLLPKSEHSANGWQRRGEHFFSSFFTSVNDQTLVMKSEIDTRNRFRVSLAGN